MKRLLVVAAFTLVVATPARADYADELCTVVARIAEAAARMHQSGVPLSTVLEAGPTVKKYRWLGDDGSAGVVVGARCLLVASDPVRSASHQARTVSGDPLQGPTRRSLLCRYERLDICPRAIHVLFARLCSSEVARI